MWSLWKGIVYALFCWSSRCSGLAFSIHSQRRAISSFESRSSSSSIHHHGPVILRMQKDGPAILDRPETIEKVDVGKKVQEDSKDAAAKQSNGGWEVRLYNDPYNKREFVARCLKTICGLSDGASYEVMMQAHMNGRAVIGRYIFERAETFHDALRDQGLLVDMVEVDEH